MEKYFLGLQKSNNRSIERWGLSYLHSDYALDELARSVAYVLGRNGRKCSVWAESIWIDGTPQAEAAMPSGKKIQCELADLLFIVEEINCIDSSSNERGVLIQGKATLKYNKLPSGNSTKKERQLLEGMDRAKPLTLYRGTSSANSSKIGTYHLFNIAHGLADCSRYLLMPKGAMWFYPIFELYAPFQVGWPKSRASSLLRTPKSIVESMQEMVISKTIGKSIVEPSKCEWSRMVNDLRGNYSNVRMAGYNNQSRINRSAQIMSLSTKASFNQNHIRSHFSTEPPTERNGENYDFTPPSISIIKIIIQNLDEERSTSAQDI